MPSMITAPRRCALGNDRSEPAHKLSPTAYTGVRKLLTIHLPELRDDIRMDLVVVHVDPQHLLKTRELRERSIVSEPR